MGGCEREPIEGRGLLKAEHQATKLNFKQNSQQQKVDKTTRPQRRAQVPSLGRDAGKRRRGFERDTSGGPGRVRVPLLLVVGL